MKYRVTFQPANTVIAVDAEETILQSALNAGHALPYSCRGGTCGACLAEVVAGNMAYPDGERPLALSEQQEAEGKALLCQAYACSDLIIKAREIDDLAGVHARVLPCRVLRLQRLAPDVMGIDLRLPAHQRLAFLAGQYIDILWQQGRRRSFSLADSPHADEHLALHVRYVPGGKFSHFVFNELQEGAILRFQGPLGTFFLRRDSERPIIMLGGGTGFAPLKAMLEEAFHQGLDRSVHLYWGARTRQDLYLHALPLRWAEQQPQFRYTPVLSAPAADDHWDGRCGWVHAAVAEDYPDLSHADVYMSGPPAMIAAAKTAFFAQGLPPEQLFYDSFDWAKDG